MTAIQVRCTLLWLLLALTIPGFAQVKPAVRRPLDAGTTFEKDIRPLLVAQCVGCHNRTTMPSVALSGGLALDSYESALKGVTIPEKPVRVMLVAGKPDESELVKRLETTDSSRRMPKGGDPLPAAKIALVKRWIAAGLPKGVAGKPIPDPTVPPPAPPGPV